MSARVVARIMRPADARANLSHPNGKVRALAAEILGVHRSHDDIRLLSKLAGGKTRGDDLNGVASSAVGALGKINTADSRRAVLAALTRANNVRRTEMLMALAKQGGGEALAHGLAAAEGDAPQVSWFRKKQMLAKLRDLADPRSADTVHRWGVDPKRHGHWRTEAGLLLAELGDRRAAPLLGARLTIASGDLYDPKQFWQANRGGHLSRTDHQRIVAARLIADLASLHPAHKDQLAAETVPQLLAWLDERPQPHANGMRALAHLGGDKPMQRLRAWAFPKDKLPAKGSRPPFPMAYSTAQSALRYIGAARDTPSFDGLLGQFDRKTDKTLDITQSGLEGANIALLGMALRAVGYGAASGLAEWGEQADRRAVGKLRAFIEDRTWHETAREQACRALAWVAADSDLRSVIGVVKKLAASAEYDERFIARCYALTLGQRPLPGLVGELVDVLVSPIDHVVRLAVGGAIGGSGLASATKAQKQALFKALMLEPSRIAAALALMLGGDQHDAQHAMARFGDSGWSSSYVALQEAWWRSFAYWSEAHFEAGSLHRWVGNAEAIGRVELEGEPQHWALDRLRGQLDNPLDNGPRSMTRVVLQARLLEQVRTEKSLAAIRVLVAMKARGALASLVEVKGEVADAAQSAAFEILNPRPQLSHAAP